MLFSLLIALAGDVNEIEVKASGMS